jgi:energy-coupling factor transport system substrate-specific component
VTARQAAVPVRSASGLILATVSLAGALAFAWPFLVRAPIETQPVDSPLLFAAVLPLLVVVALVEVTAGRLDARALAMLGVLSAIGAAVRPLGGGTAGVETVFVLIVLGGRVFGPGFGFVLGSTTLFASALMTGGVGPWLPFQMLAASWMGLGAGLLPPVRGRGEVVVLIGYGIVAAIGFGLAMNLWLWPFATGLATDLSFVAGAPLLDNLQRFLVFSLVTSAGWEFGRAVTTAILLLLVGPSVLGVLRRAARRARFGEAAIVDAAAA